jgi:membrane glycosyltransferase
VWLVGDLAGSYEQQPPDLLSELQRDRRWCHGNLQNARLMAEPGLHRVHRAVFAIGAMSYLSAPLWLVFMSFGTALWISGATVAPDWHAVPAELRSLWAWTLAMLFMPRVLGLAAVFLRRGQASFGGAGALLRSAVLETVLAVLQAPVRMLAHSLFVLVSLTGLKLEWKSPPRSASGLSWTEAATRLAPMTGLMALQGVAVASVHAGALVWLTPVGLPLLLAIPLAVLTSNVAFGRWLRERQLLLIPEEARSPAVLRRAWHRPAALAAA